MCRSVVATSDDPNSGPIELDQETRQVRVGGKSVVLSTTEFRLLRYLLLRAGGPVSRSDLEQHVWDADERIASNVIDVYISYLRKILGPGGALIRTVRGFGYTLTAEGGRRD